MYQRSAFADISVWPKMAVCFMFLRVYLDVDSSFCGFYTFYTTTGTRAIPNIVNIIAVTLGIYGIMFVPISLLNLFL